MSTYEEWRVTGTWEGDAYAFTWSPRGYSPTGHPEGEARGFIRAVRDHDWTDGPHLHKRTVTVTDWTEVDA